MSQLIESDTRFILFLLFCIAAFVSTPTSVNATLGSTATFNCSATTGVVGWLVNGSTLTELDSPFLSTSTFSLNVSATEEYNNTVVICQLFLRDPFSVETSEPAVLGVQGMYTCFTYKRMLC